MAMVCFSAVLEHEPPELGTFGDILAGSYLRPDGSDRGMNGPLPAPNRPWRSPSGPNDGASRPYHRARVTERYPRASSASVSVSSG